MAPMSGSSAPDYKSLFLKAEEDREQEAELRREAEKRQKQVEEREMQTDEREGQQRERTRRANFREFIASVNN
jgi:hypothetical protein